jgi:hypothetical protein
MSFLPLPLVRDPSVPEGARAVGIAAIVSGILGLLVLPIIFGPIAIVLGVVAVAQHHRAAWWGIGLGAAQLVMMVSAYLEISR